MLSSSPVVRVQGLIRLVAQFSPRHIVMLISLGAYLLVLPCLNEDLFRDDFYHRAILTGENTIPGTPAAAPMSLWEASQDLFSFFGADNENLTKGMEAGVVPWWADPHLEIRFWRPISAVTHWLDYQLWPNSSMLMHLHSALWYTLLVFAYGYFLREFRFQGWALLAAMMAYGMDASHIPSIAWVANRNILLSTFFAFLSLAKLNHAVKSNSKLSLGLSCVFFAASLLSAEAGISTAAYIASYFLFMDTRRLRLRIATYLPYALVLVGWRVLYQAMGYAVKNSGAYFDPVAQPEAFFQNLLVQVPILMMDQFTGLESNALIMAPNILVQQAWIAAVIVSLFILTAIPMLKHSRTSRFLLVGALLSLTPIGSTIFTGGRLLFFAGAGICAAYGLFLSSLFASARWLPRLRIYRFWAYFVVIGMTFTNVISNSILWGSQIYNQIERDDHARFSPLSDIVTPYNHVASVVVVVNPPVSFDLLYSQLKGAYLGQTIPHQIRTLAPGITGFNLTRTATNRIEINSDNQPFAMSSQAPFPQGPVQSIYYAAQRADTFFAGNQTHRKAGDKVALPGTIITIKQTDNVGVPTRVAFEFEESLDNAKYQWLQFNPAHRRFVAFAVPAVGETVHIDGPF